MHNIISTKKKKEKVAAAKTTIATCLSNIGDHKIGLGPSNVGRVPIFVYAPMLLLGHQSHVVGPTDEMGWEMSHAGDALIHLTVARWIIASA